MRISWVGIALMVATAAWTVFVVTTPGAGSAAGWGIVVGFVGAFTLIIRGLRGKPDDDPQP